MSLQMLIQAGPIKANELFGKLAETSADAVEARERLFEELKLELELHTTLEEQHLFPVLETNDDTRQRVEGAIRDNAHLRSLLDQLAVIPKNDEAFGARLLEVQLAFKLHAMDERKEILPAVKYALSEDHVQQAEQGFTAIVADAERIHHDAPLSQPDGLTELPKKTVRGNLETAESNAIKLTEMITNTVQETICETGPAAKAQRDLASVWLETVEHAFAVRREFYRHAAERQIQLTADVTKWWFQQNSEMMQLALSPFSQHLH
jgi:hypothetical protein